jgi:opacity protein-like surface antigen
MTRSMITFSLALLASAATAQAQDQGGYYLKGTVGLSKLQGSELTIDNTSSDLSYGADLAAGGAVGYDYAGSPLRAELEFMWRTGAAEDLPVGVGTGGNYASTTLMVNGYYMIESGTAITPYVGAGLGYVTEIDFDIDDAVGASEYSDSGLLAYQIMAGTEYAATDQIAVFAEARYFVADAPTLSGSGGSRLEADYDSFDLLAGLTWSF